MIEMLRNKDFSESNRSSGQQRAIVGNCLAGMPRQYIGEVVHNARIDISNVSAGEKTCNTSIENKAAVAADAKVVAIKHIILAGAFQIENIPGAGKWTRT